MRVFAGILWVECGEDSSVCVLLLVVDRLGAALTRPGRVGVTFPGTKLRGAELVGMPMPAAITDLDRDDPSVRAAARAALGLTDSRPVLVVTAVDDGG